MYFYLLYILTEYWSFYYNGISGESNFILLMIIDWWLWKRMKLFQVVRNRRIFLANDKVLKENTWFVYYTTKKWLFLLYHLSGEHSECDRVLSISQENGKQS